MPGWTGAGGSDYLGAAKLAELRKENALAQRRRVARLTATRRSSRVTKTSVNR
jgi:hypothetical protein